MPRILICTVGGRPEPIVTAVRENAPLDHVVFLCSGGQAPASSSSTVSCSTLRQARRRCPHCGQDYVDRERVAPLVKMAQLAEDRFSVERVGDPDDLGQVYGTCEQIEADLISRWPRNDATVIAN